MSTDASTDTEKSAQDSSEYLDSRWKNLSGKQLADEAVTVATRQLMASTDFKKPRLATLAKYWQLYDGKVQKKLRQLFNVPIPVFPGMIDTLNAQYDTPIRLKFKEGDAADYFKVQKINGAFQMEVMNTAQNSKWDSKLRMARKHAIMNGIAIPKLTAESDPEYKSELEIVNLKNYHFQPRGGLYNENHLFNGEEDIEKTRSELVSGARSGSYDQQQVKELLRLSADSDYLPDGRSDMSEKLSRFKPLGLNPDNTTYVGESVFKLASWILNIDGTRYYLCWHPWTKIWLRFEPWKDMCSSELYPWNPYTTHEDDENLLSKSYGDDAYAACDAIVAMFNQELTNREKRNFGTRYYDKDMFKDVRKLDEAQYRPDALVPADTMGGTKRISEGIFEFKSGELNGTVNLIDWTVSTLGRNNGANDMAQGSVTDVSKKASVAFAEQKSVSKRLSWGAQPFQDMMAGLGKRYIYGLKDHMPSKMAIRMMGERGWEWEQITRLDLDTTKDVDVLIESTDKQQEESDMNMEKRKNALEAIGADPILSPIINAKWRASELLSAVGGYEDAEIAEATDTKSNNDKKSLAKASEAIQLILQGKQPVQWFGATPAFMQKIVDFASDNRATLGEKFDQLLEYASSHEQIAMQNIERKAMEDARAMQMQQGIAPGAAPAAPGAAPSKAQNPGVPPGVSHAMNIAQLAA
ncbi:hypothetical protein IVB45_02255 [Bradyrhizobium sp. 4]|uniref:hypothetical protein n=1 Tax=Bradyrhizobium sp. 4 TaxID=2782678 RepID=UPI001FFE771E|nr:hypothetical protein [Bradyrhizobium sp. 4]UPJ35857.1 hypothetical protein IVB45_02255 [Bradyrhizobium sp. 4]